MKKSNVLSIVLIMLFVIMSLLTTLGISFWTQKNKAIKLENKIKIQYADNKNTYDNIWKKFKEITQVSELQAEQFKDVYMGLIIGGNQDKNSLFKLIQESNLQLSTEIYMQLQREISADRETFKNSQTKLLDMIREYNDCVETNLFMIILEKQSLNVDDYIIAFNRTNDSFNEKKDDKINLFK